VTEPVLTPAAPPQTPTLGVLLQNLAHTNNFTLDDLTANRGGRVSGRQGARLRKSRGRYMLFSVIALVVAVALGIWSVATVNSTAAAQIHRYSIGAAVLFGVFGFGSLLVARGRGRDVQDGSVRRREGVLKLAYLRPPTTGTGGGQPTYLYVIGGASYSVSIEAWQAAIADLRYCAYEAQDGLLLSIEPLATEAPAMPPTPPPPALGTPDLAGSAVTQELRDAPSIPSMIVPETKLTGGSHSPPQPFSASAGLVVLAVTCSGSGTVGLRILSTSGDELLSPFFADLSESGGFLRVSWGVHLDSGNYMLSVDHQADLALAPFHWTVVITQPSGGGSVRLPTTYGGKRRAVVGPFACGDRIRLTARNKTRDRRYVSFSVEVLANDGRATDAIRGGAANYGDSVTVTGLSPGAHWLNVDSDGSWTITVNDA
jgi:hypothetical protein